MKTASGFDMLLAMHLNASSSTSVPSCKYTYDCKHSVTTASQSLVENQISITNPGTFTLTPSVFLQTFFSNALSFSSVKLAATTRCFILSSMLHTFNSICKERSRIKFADGKSSLHNSHRYVLRNIAGKY